MIDVFNRNQIYFKTTLAEDLMYDNEFDVSIIAYVVAMLPETATIESFSVMSESSPIYSCTNNSFIVRINYIIFPKNYKIMDLGMGYMSFVQKVSPRFYHLSHSLE